MKTPMTIQTEKTLREIGDCFRQFSRNGRWGTCGGCPRDVQGNAYPEHCADTDRYDHHLTATGLAETWDIYFKGNVLKSGQNVKSDGTAAAETARTTDSPATNCCASSFVLEQRFRPGWYLEDWGDGEGGPYWTNDLNKAEKLTLDRAQYEKGMLRDETLIIPHNANMEAPNA